MAVVALMRGVDQFFVGDPKDSGAMGGITVQGALLLTGLADVVVGLPASALGWWVGHEAYYPDETAQPTE